MQSGTRFQGAHIETVAGVLVAEKFLPKIDCDGAGDQDGPGSPVNSVLFVNCPVLARILLQSQWMKGIRLE
jgi:hypothetical protein